MSFSEAEFDEERFLKSCLNFVSDFDGGGEDEESTIFEDSAKEEDLLKEFAFLGESEVLLFFPTGFPTPRIFFPKFSNPGDEG
jgi:hypothetical protein